MNFSTLKRTLNLITRDMRWFARQFSDDRIEPSQYFVYPWLYLKVTSDFLCRRKLGSFGENSEIRPGASLFGTQNILIGNNVVIRDATQIHASSKRTPDAARVFIEDDVLIAPGVFITTNEHVIDSVDIPIRLQGARERSVYLRNGCWIGAYAIVLAGVTIGVGSVIGASAVVTRDVPDWSVAVGVPARVIKSRLPGEIPSVGLGMR